MANNLTSYDALTERINFICYKLEHYTFLTKEEREKLKNELDQLVKSRALLLETLQQK